MKKYLSMFVSAVLMLGIISPVCSSYVPYRIYSDIIESEKGGILSVPVSLENNGGIMGFTVVVTYDADVFTPVSAIRGTILSAGLFNDSIETADSGSFKVIYTGNADITADGVLFTLNFNLSANAVGNYSIGLSYVQADTFKEGWADVVLHCEDIRVTINGDEQNPDNSLSERINNWFNGLPAVLRVVLFIFVKPIAFIVSLFE